MQNLAKGSVLSFPYLFLLFYTSANHGGASLSQSNFLILFHHGFLLLLFALAVFLMTPGCFFHCHFMEKWWARVRNQHYVDQHYFFCKVILLESCNSEMCLPTPSFLWTKPRGFSETFTHIVFLPWGQVSFIRLLLDRGSSFCSSRTIPILSAS